MVLAAGMGTRLKPLTENKPKCLMPLAGRPLIEWTLAWLKKYGITECVINLHYLPDMVRDFVGDGSRFNLDVRYSYESQLLGTAGAVKKVKAFFKDEPFYVIYSDNFSQWDLKKLRANTASPQSSPARGEEEIVGIMAVHWREDVTSSGVVEMDGAGRIVRYVEKPLALNVTSHYVNAGFYYLHPKVFAYIPTNQFCDFSYDVFPKILQAGHRMYAVKMDEPIIGIDTLEAYERADELAQSIMKREA